jgi:hypothetical protein
VAEGVSVDVGEMFGALGEQVRGNALTIILAVAGLTAANLALDQLSKDGSGTFFLSGLTALGAQYYVTRAALDRAGFLPEGRPGRFGSFWGMNILTGLAILVGCILLVLPGLYLLARWLIAAPVILAEDKTAGEGMRESWEMMGGSAWQAVGAVLVLYVCGFALALGPLLLFEVDSTPMAVQVVSYIVLFGTTVSGWLMAVGVYAMVAQRHRSLEEVFA